MLGLDDAIGGLGSGGAPLGVALAVALLLGLRHATDPDHLTAVSTLVLSRGAGGSRRAARLGAAWGLGHALTLLAVGLPVVLVGGRLPNWLQRLLELAVGVVIVALAVRLLVRWRRGYFHTHVHEHDDVAHAHPHMHEGPHAASHEHSHAHDRSPRAAFALGLLHGAGGSAGVGVLLLAAIPSPGTAAAALVVLAAGTGLSMMAVSAAFGWTLGRAPLTRRFELVAPLVGTLSLLFGLWYGLGALDAVPY